MNYIPAFITTFPFPIILNFKRFSALPGKGNVAQKSALNKEFSVRELWRLLKASRGLTIQIYRSLNRL